MKESVTKFDFESAFKALDEIDIPVAEKGIKANRPALTEIFSRKNKFDVLFEEYYDLGSQEELGEAQEAREAEIAKAKLARIEKIVDLDAESPEDLLTSYVGKYIIQCPQCMTLFYKNKEDVVESEEDQTTVNVNEVCQHCGNESGYTLIGKVGEAEAEDDFVQDETDLELEVDVPEEAAEEPTVEESEDTATDDELSLSDEDLEALDLNLDEGEAEDDSKKEEAHFVAHDGEALVEELQEDANLEVSAEEFEKLINSTEFKKPISDSAVQAMLNSEKETEEEKTAVEESLVVNDETLEFAVINPDGTYAGVPCTSEEEARELANQKDGRVIAELDAIDESLEEGIFDKLFQKKLKSRADIAEFILNTAMEDYDKVIIDKAGKVSVDEANRKFNTFIILGYKEVDSTGAKITKAVEYNSKNLVVGMKHPEVKKTYTEAENIAKGWSMREGNGPAFIYLAKNEAGDGAAFLCQYFNGALDENSDQLTKYKETITKNIESAKLMKKGGADQADTKDIPASKITAGMRMQLTDGSSAEVSKVEASRISNKLLKIELSFESGETETINVAADQTLQILRTPLRAESLEAIVAGLEELQEEALEEHITYNLVETCDNVKSFKLTDCSYINEQLIVTGEIGFATGDPEKTSYVFTEAFSTEDNQLVLSGTNQRFGVQKFTINGRVDEASKSFITEAFN